MLSFWSILGRNRNYRYLWLGQVVSEIGDHFNSIAVLSLQNGCIQSVSLGQLDPTLPELASRANENIVAGREEILDRGLQSTRPRRHQYQNLICGSKHFRKVHKNPFVQAPKVLGAVMDVRTHHCVQRGRQ